MAYAKHNVFLYYLSVLKFLTDLLMFFNKWKMPEIKNNDISTDVDH